MIAANFENLLFLLLVVVAVLFQWLAKTAGKTSKDQTKRTSTPITRTLPPMRRAPTESDEDRIRKFLEALGQPPTSRPPPPVVPRTEIPPRSLAPVQPPTAYPPSPWKLIQEQRRKREVAKGRPAPPTITRVEKIVPPKITDAPAFEVHEESFLAKAASIIKAPAEAYAGGMRTIAKTEEPRTEIAALLASTSGLRDAVILREILGPPRGLRAQMEFSDGIA
jgi:hypothetical protein